MNYFISMIGEKVQEVTVLNWLSKVHAGQQKTLFLTEL